MHHTWQRLMLTAAMAAIGVSAVAPAAVGAAPRTAPTPVADAVTAKLLGQADMLAGGTAGADRTRVTVTRENGRWAFGTAVVLADRTADAHPTGSIFLARADAKGWTVAFDGEASFGDMAEVSPLVSRREKTVFTAPVTPMYASGDYRTGMALPFAVGQSWTLTGGPHGWSGSAAPWSSIDLAGGDQVVRAARGGTAYTMCTGWIRVIHDRGYSTDYYHLWSSISVNGAAVGQGAYLGYTGTDVTCGGAASGRHVHFGLRQNGAYVPIAGHSLGKWEFVNGAVYQGGARHGSVWAGAGAGLYNYGALGFNQGIVDTNGGGTLTRRSGPGTGYGSLGSIGDGATVTISCSANGTSHTGRYGTTSLWNRLSDGSWVSDAYLATGVNGPINGWC